MPKTPPDRTADRSHAQALARRAEQRRRAGEDAACARCGIRELAVLIPVRARLIEAHHVAGRAVAPDDLIWLCRNCHAIETARLRGAGVSMLAPATLLERDLGILQARAQFFAALAATDLRRAAALARLLEALDARFPDWRSIPEAQYADQLFADCDPRLYGAR